jgi:hypothetical protein
VVDVMEYLRECETWMRNMINMRENPNTVSEIMGVDYSPVINPSIFPCNPFNLKMYLKTLMKLDDTNSPGTIPSFKRPTPISVMNNAFLDLISDLSYISNEQFKWAIGLVDHISLKQSIFFIG